jgi:glycosyltransferase involved in cell wall biosynthesis
MNSLSVIVITKNEASHIQACLESVYFANEIIVLDSGSTDNTVPLAKQFTPHVYEVDWPGYGVQKNRALAKATCEWVLSLDADEVVSPELAQEIQTIIRSQNSPTATSLPKTHAYVVPRLARRILGALSSGQTLAGKDMPTAYAMLRSSTYCNQVMRHGDWKNDYCLRLFRRDCAHFEELPVHEKLLLKNGTARKLKNVLYHDTSENLEEMLVKLNTYSTLSAQHKYQAGRKSSLRTAILHGLWTFLRGYIVRGGFLDGKKGLMLAISNAEGCYYRYLKIMMLQES